MLVTVSKVLFFFHLVTILAHIVIYIHFFGHGSVSMAHFVLYAGEFISIFNIRAVFCFFVFLFFLHLRTF